MVTIANGIAARGHALDLVLVRADGPYMRDVSGSVRIVDLNSSRVITSVPGLIRYLRKERPAVMLSALSHANVAALVARALARVETRVIVSERNSQSGQGKSGLAAAAVLRQLVRLTYPWAEGVISVSCGITDELRREFGLAPEKLHTIYNPIEMNKVRRLAASRPEHPWLAPEGPPLVLTVGRLVPQKDYPTLLRAFALLRKRRPAHLMILGEGSERGSLIALADRLGISHDVELRGFEQNPWGWMAACSVFVLSSRWEGLPNAMIEAMACGARIVSTDCPTGPSEILQGGRYGRLVPVGDHDALAAAIEDALGDSAVPDLAAGLAPFGMDGVTDGYLRVLEAQ